ncbi:hypothetical protein SAMN03159496_00455 [Rhizobium sp. NFR07]|uniref:hypothetical protein n=1 Tax=Rhizobium sp. NFR07 TaxID=1566262 RepID=UPI0008EEF267|nr:hypothetical protein [Rhizobium sp. NFR07]SFA80338.1 hypothetical protein SAMN03159496_00455 [Rhizobium sp. NFR07]
MLKLHAIGRDGLEAAAELLLQGFPSRSLAFWQDGLKRLSDYSNDANAGSIGNMLMADGVPVGVLLTINRRDSQTDRKIVNLSGWYVREDHRWYAPRMLLSALSDAGAVYTDLTPSDAAVAMNDRLGFRTIGYDVHLLPLPLLAVTGRGRGRLRSIDDLPEGALAGPIRQDLARHRALGCIVTTIEAGGKFHPLVFDTFRRKGIPIARVIYAESNDLIIEHLGPLSRHLIARGIPLLSLRMPERSTLPCSWLWRRGLRYQVKGEWDERKTDELYSERVLLKV